MPQFLQGFKIFIVLFAAGFAAFVGGTLAMIFGAMASGATADFLPQLRWVEGTIGAIGGAMGGGALAWQGKHDKGFGLGLFSRVALLGVAMPVLRLGLYQQGWPLTQILFLSLGFALLLLGSMLILDIVLQIKAVAALMPGLATVSRTLSAVEAIPLLIFVPLSLTLLLFGAYATSGIELTCQRVESTQIDCQLIKSRWLGQVIETASLSGLQSWDDDFDRLVLNADSGSVVIESGLLHETFIIAHDLDVFVNSAQPSFKIDLPPRWIFFGSVLIAGVLTSTGFSSIPLAPVPPNTPWPRLRYCLKIFRSTYLILGLMFSLWGLGFFLLVLPQSRALVVEDENTVVLTRADMLANLPDGTELFIEGYLSESNETVIEQYVLAYREWLGSEDWIYDESFTPFFLLDVAVNGSVVSRKLPIKGEKYGIVADDDLLEWYPDTLVDGAEVRYRGYVRGDFVTVYGQVIRVEGRPQVEAWTVDNVPVQAMLEADRQRLRLMTGGGIVLVTAGLIFLGVFGGKLFKAWVNFKD